MLTRTLIGVVVGFVVGTPVAFWLLKKVRIKTKVRHIQVSVAFSLPIALFVFLLQTNFAVPVVVITVTVLLLVVALELTLRRIVAKSGTCFGSFKHGRSGGGVEYSEAKDAAGTYPDDYLTEDFWMEQSRARRSFDNQKLEFKKNNPNIAVTHKIAQECSVNYRHYNVSHGIRNTTDDPGSDSQDLTKVFLLGGSPLSGQEVPDRLTSSSFLQRILNDQKINIRVINCGCSGSSVLGRTEFLKDLRVENSIIVFIFGVNDSGWYDRKTKKLSVDSVGLALRALRAIIDLNSTLASFLYNKISPWCYRKSSTRAVNDAIASFYDAYEFCIRNSANMISILEPNLYTRRLIHGYENRLILRFNRDLRTLINQSYKQYEDWIQTVHYGVSATHIFDNSHDSIFLDWCHVNARGNEIIAKFIFEELNKRKLFNFPSEVSSGIEVF